MTEAQERQRRLAPVRSGAYARGPEVRKLRDQRARSRMRRKRRELPHVGDQDRDLLLAWARLEVIAQDLYADVLGRGAFNAQGEARRAVDDFRRTQQAAAALDRELQARNAAGASSTRDQLGDLAAVGRKLRIARKDES